MVSFMQSRGYGSQSGNSINNFHSVFDNGTADTGTPPLLDLSEFPSLTNARGGGGPGGQGGDPASSLPQSNALQPPGSKPYGKCKLTSVPPATRCACTFFFLLLLALSFERDSIEAKMGAPSTF